MKFEPKTDQELAKIEEENLMPAGVYDFEVVGAEDAFSTKGNEMSKVTLQIEDGEGRQRRVIDYLVSTDAMAYKIKQFAEGVGMLAQYQKGEFSTDDMRGRTGRCKIVVAPAKGEYRAKNTVAGYLKIGAAPGNGASPPMGDPRPAAPPFDDDIPF